MEDIEEQNALLSAILESSPDVIVFALDRSYRYLTFNKKHFDTIKAIWGKEISIGTNMLEIIGKDEDRERAKSNFDKALSGVSFSLIEDYGDEALQRLVWQDYYSPILSNEGEVIGLTCYCLDMTEREETKKALQDANNKLRIIASITRHDGINKLTALHGYLTILMRKTEDQKMLSDIEKMAGIVSDLEGQLNFTREYQEIGMLKPKWQNVYDLCERAKIDLNIVSIDVSFDAKGMEIFADPMLGKVFYNLMDNSLKHGEHVIRIEVSVEMKGDELLVVYQDNGVGLTDDQKRKLFREEFGKEHGLGMLLIKEILKISGISITETGVPGKGARFELLVPLGRFRSTEDLV